MHPPRCTPVHRVINDYVFVINFLAIFWRSGTGDRPSRVRTALAQNRRTSVFGYARVGRVGDRPILNHFYVLNSRSLLTRLVINDYVFVINYLDERNGDRPFGASVFGYARVAQESGTDQF